MGNEEGDPNRTTKSNQFETKVMFIWVVARPLWDTHTNRNFMVKKISENLLLVIWNGEESRFYPEEIWQLIA